MKNIQHKNLVSGKWKKMSFLDQMANIGSEVERTIIWKEKKNNKYSELAFDRALELLDLTIADRKNISKLKELTRLRELMADYFVFENEYNCSDKEWQNYFYEFNYASRRDH